VICDENAKSDALPNAVVGAASSRAESWWGQAMNGNFTNFRAVYDDLTSEVGRSSKHFLPDHLRNWFQTIDTTPDVFAIVQELQSGLDFEGWYKQCQQARGGMGSARLLWPEQPEKRLGMQLLLFRGAATGTVDLGLAGFIFIPSDDRNVDAGARRFIDQVFGPMARELRRLLELRLGSAATAPASDRTVTLDHNSPAYKETEDALEALERALTEANDYPDPEDKEQRIAEVSATRRLLNSARVRIGAVVALIGPSLAYFTTQLGTTAIGRAASALVDKLVALLGSIF
jgi:hypothetical protein